MTCTNCQNEITIHSMFCSHCGTKQEPTEAKLLYQEPLEETDVVDELIKSDQRKEYKKSKRKLVIRISSTVLFLISGLVLCITDGDLLSFVAGIVPLSCWASYLVTYMLGDGILGFFSKVWSIICAVAAFVFASIFYGIIMLVLLFIVLVVLSMLGNVATWILGAAAIIGLYAGVVINIIAGIKDYNSVVMYKNV